MFNLANFFKNLKKNTKIQNDIISNFNIYSVGFMGSISHPLYLFWWTYIDPRNWEIPILRFIGFITCFSLLLLPLWPKNLKKFAQKYWLFVLTYNLPFFFTFYFISSHAHVVWVASLFAMTFLSIMFMVRILPWAIHTIVGITFAILLAIILKIDLSFLNYDLIVLNILPIFIFALFTAFIFSYSNSHGIANEIERREKFTLAISKERHQILQALGGSIAHEMRNPLGSIHQSVYLILDKFKQVPKGKKILVKKEDITEIEELLNLIDYSSTRGNMMIDMILSNIYDQETDKSKFKIYKISDVVNTVLKEFAFSSAAEKSKISVKIENDFYFKGDENMMVFVLFNLLKNALYYLELHPESLIIISSKKENSKNSQSNYLYFKDTGPGIPEEKLESIFEPFMTSEKVGGTGLGLPFCRRVMASFDGTIICDSKLGKYTKFVLSFPKIAAEEIKNEELLITKNKKSHAAQIIKKIYADKTVLLVDDQMVNRKLTSYRLEKLGFKVLIAHHGQEALDILSEKGNEIDMILLDLQMPEIDGYEVARLIKSGHKNQKGEQFANFKNYQNIFLIAFSGNDDPSTMQKIREHEIKWFLGKSWINDDLVLLVKKWLDQENIGEIKVKSKISKIKK